jgi:pyrroloquinoline quinone biosynthesis protein B
VVPDEVRVVLVGIAQDGGVPQAGCGCDTCIAALSDPSKALHPACCLVMGSDGSLHLIEASRALPQQLGIAARSLGIGDTIVPDTVSLTHAHLGHIDGLGQFGKEVMGSSGTSLFASKRVIDFIRKRGLISPFEANNVESSEPFSPSGQCGFQFEFIPVPHRDEFSDTHAIKVIGPSSSLLFLPDHDDWEGTLDMAGQRSIRDWLNSLEVDFALIDGTFWSGDELGSRDMSQIPHPPISDTIGRLGRREDEDPEVIFFHLNHTNPSIDRGSTEYQELASLGWSIGEQGSTFVL